MGPVGLAFSASVLLWSGGPTEQQIDWEASEGCPSEAAVVEATDEYLGHALVDYPRAVVARARVETDPSGFRLRLELEVDGAVERHQLTGADCDRLGRDVAMLIATAVDPFARGPVSLTPTNRQLGATTVVQHPSPRSPTPVEVPFDAPPSLPETPPARLSPPEIVRVHPPDRAGVVGTFAVGGAGFVGLFPNAGGGAVMDGGIERGLFRWQLGVNGWFGGRFRAPASDVGFQMWALTGSTGVCVAPALRRFRFAACAAGGLGAITARSVNTRNQLSQARPWAFLGPDLRAIWTPGARVGVYLDVAAQAALVRPGWSVRNPDAEFRIPPVTGVLSLGIELRSRGAR